MSPDMATILSKRKTGSPIDENRRLGWTDIPKNFMVLVDDGETIFFGHFTRRYAAVRKIGETRAAATFEEALMLSRLECPDCFLFYGNHEVMVRMFLYVLEERDYSARLANFYRIKE